MSAWRTGLRARPGEDKVIEKIKQTEHWDRSWEEEWQQYCLIIRVYNELLHFSPKNFSERKSKIHGSKSVPFPLYL